MIEITELQDPQRFTDLIEMYVNSLDVKSSSKETYVRALQQFREWFLAGRVGEITPGTLVSFKKHLRMKKVKTLTISLYIVPAKRFLEWCGYGEKVKDVKGEKRDRGFRKDPLTIDQIQEFLQACDRSTLRGKRDYAVINLMLRTGLRTREVIHADVRDIRQQSGEAVLYILGKGREEKTDFVLLTPDSLRPINEYLAARKSRSEEEPLFTSLSHRNLGERLNTKAIRRIVKDYLRKIGIESERLSAHSLRHTAITLALLGGAGLQEAKEMARHSNINTTLIYSHNIDRLKNAAEKKVDQFLKIGQTK